MRTTRRNISFMVGDTRQDEHPPGGSLDLLQLASARPGEAMAKARAVLAADPPPHEASVARQAIGMLLREFGDLDAAIGELRMALRLARLSRSSDRVADVRATLGVALIYAGRTTSGFAALDEAAPAAAGAMTGCLLQRR